MAEFYSSLGLDVVIDAILKADDANGMVTAVARELDRRGLDRSSAALREGDVALSSYRDRLRADLERMGYDGSANPKQARITAREIKDYVTYIQRLYAQNLVG